MLWRLLDHQENKKAVAFQMVCLGGQILKWRLIPGACLDLESLRIFCS